MLSFVFSVAGAWVASAAAGTAVGASVAFAAAATGAVVGSAVGAAGAQAARSMAKIAITERIFQTFDFIFPPEYRTGLVDGRE
jgi:hypothetical protein